MADTQDTSVELIRSLVQNISGPVVDWENWESLAIIIESFDNRYNSAHGFAYSPDGTISAVAASPSVVIPFVDAYVAGYFKEDEELPIKLLVQFNRNSGKYKITFEDTDETRWKVSPRTIKTIHDEIRPNFDEPTATP